MAKSCFFFSQWGARLASCAFANWTNRRERSYYYRYVCIVCCAFVYLVELKWIENAVKKFLNILGSTVERRMYVRFTFQYTSIKCRADSMRTSNILYFAARFRSIEFFFLFFTHPGSLASLHFNSHFHYNGKYKQSKTIAHTPQVRFHQIDAPGPYCRAHAK